MNQSSFLSWFTGPASLFLQMCYDRVAPPLGQNNLLVPQCMSSVGLSWTEMAKTADAALQSVNIFGALQHYSITLWGVCEVDVNSQFWESILNSGCQFSIMVANSKFWVSIRNSPSECLLFHSRLAGNRGSNWNSSSACILSYFAREIENISIENVDFCLVYIVHRQQKKGGGKQLDN